MSRSVGYDRYCRALVATCVELAVFSGTRERWSAVTESAATGDPWSVCEKCGVRWRIDHKCMTEPTTAAHQHGTARDICDRCDNSGKRLVEFGGVTMWLCLTCLMAERSRHGLR